ncbi:hypothetical protein SAMN05444422_102355 [Halobiforma haloterrestris]|uniref:Domain of unknown function domain-containing protein n=1 Tax=Natronobacterium haloterrestre TaxID=148448 RepID=A0A1I1EHU2_NATHA|nr:hypothetical protein [Halobiforma haloterrestris]SFB84523.1 hypothetical protein SAMN05444422_102355 [Halobiforma haloterrestris]
MNTDPDRDRGVLSPADRSYLLGETTMSHEQSRRNAEARIRQRVENAILDFDLLLHTLAEKDRRQIFDDVHTDQALLDGLRAMVAFAYVGTKEQGLEFDEVLVPAIRASEEAAAAKRANANVSVDVTFDVETTSETPLEGVAKRLEAGEPVTPRELFSLIMRGEDDPARHESISLVGTDAEGVDDQFLERLATYLEGEVRRETDSRAVIELVGEQNSDGGDDGGD